MSNRTNNYFCHADMSVNDRKKINKLQKGPETQQQGDIESNEDSDEVSMLRRRLAELEEQMAKMQKLIEGQTRKMSVFETRIAGLENGDVSTYEGRLKELENEAYDAFERRISEKEEKAQELRDDSDQESQLGDLVDQPVPEEASAILSTKSDRTGEDLVSLLAAQNAKLPVWKGLEKLQIKKFIKEYKAYKKQTPKGTARDMQAFAEDMDLAAIAESAGLSEDELNELSMESFIEKLCGVHKSTSLNNTSDALALIKMKSDDLDIAATLAYIEEFEFEIKFAGKKFMLCEEELAKTFCYGVRPEMLKKELLKSKPKTFETAKKLFHEYAKVQREYEMKKKSESVLNKRKFSEKESTTSSTKKEEGKAEKKQTTSEKSTDLSKIQCHKCQQFGHYASDCKNARVARSSSSKDTVKSNKIVKAKRFQADEADEFEESSVISVKKSYRMEFQFDEMTDSELEMRSANEAQTIEVEEFPEGNSSDNIIFDKSELVVDPVDGSDALFWLSGHIWKDGKAKIDCPVKVFCDNGSQRDMIKKEFLEQMEKREGRKFPRAAGIPIKLEMGNKQLEDVDRDRVLISLQVQVEGKQVVFRRYYLIYENTPEEITIGIKTLCDLGILSVIERERRVNKAELMPETSKSEEEERVSQWEHTLDEVSIKKVSHVAAVVEEMPCVDVNPEFPKLKELLALIKKYQNLFAEFDSVGITNVEPMRIELKEGGTFRKLPSRYLSPVVLNLVKTEIERLQNLGIIERTTSAEGASPLVVVVKPDGSIRLAVDYRDLNSNIRYTANSIPNMKSKFPYLSGKKYFAKMDNLFGYHQWRVSEESKDLTTIATPFGTFRFNFCPFGISIAPGLYQDVMENQILGELSNERCVVFIDDTVSGDETPDGFLEGLELIFERLLSHNVKLKPSKCRFGYESVEFVGHVFDQNGYHLSDKRKQGIVEMQVPKTLKQLRSFLGMVNFFRDFIPNLSNLLVPLTDLTKGERGVRNRDIEWNSQAQEAFEKTKSEILDAGCLHVISEIGELILFTDASDLGSGWCLMQKQVFLGEGEGKWVPICFGSHKWSQAAKNWSTIQKELYGIFSGITDCSSYLLGRHFILATDHRNLVYLRNSKIPKLVRWHLALMEFNFTIVHVPGVDNVVADVLSRFFKTVVVEDKPFEVEELLQSVHNSHVGHLGTKRLVKALQEQGIEWTDMKKDIQDYVSKCPICQKLKSQGEPRVVTEGYTLAGSAAMEDISVDTIGPLLEDEDGNKYILHIMCSFSKFNYLKPAKSTDAMSYIRGIMEWIGLFGVPKRVRSDGGTQFTAKICKELAELLGFKHFVIIPYHPQANGDNERWNAEISQGLRALVLDKRVSERWSEYLPIVQRILNGSYTTSIKTYPARVIFGDNLPIAQPFIFRKDREEPFQPIDHYIRKLNDDITVIAEILNAKFKHDLKLRQDKMVKESDDKVVAFEENEFVLLTYPTKRPSKLSSLYRGPLKIVKKLREDMFEVLDLVSQKVLTVHIDRLRKFKKGGMNENEILHLASSDVNEFVVKEILDHRYKKNARKAKGNLEFLVSWEGYDPGDDSWVPYANVKDVQALDVYSETHPELNLG